MSSWAAAATANPVLRGSEGNLVWVRISVEPRLLERLLDGLAHVPFPINPEIAHLSTPKPLSSVEFPAYAGRLDEVRRTLSAYGFDESAMSVSSLFHETRPPAAKPLARSA